MKTQLDDDCDIVIHIGMPKVCTTFLQNSVFPKMDLNFINTYYLSSYIDKNKVNLISDGGMSSVRFFSWQSEREDRIHRVKRLFPHARIVLGMRDSESYVKSWYRESVHVGCTMAFDEYHEKIF